jgi:H+/Cl- antiporter ClcA
MQILHDFFKRPLLEETVLFISILKWVLLAAAVGAIVGGATALFLELLRAVLDLAQAAAHSYLLLPFALTASGLLIRYLGPAAGGYGTEKVIEAVHKAAGRIRLAVVPVKLLATLITAGAGGSVGQIGPCAQIGAALSSLLADLLRFDDPDRKKLVICGISAGFASVLGAPIAGAIFGVEVLFVGGILYEVLLPSLVAGIVGFQVASALGITFFQFTVGAVPSFSHLLFWQIVLSGLFFGLCSLFLIETMKAGEAFARKIRIWPPLRGLIGGAILIGLVQMVSTDFLGLGIEGLRELLGGAEAPWYAFPLKALFTSLTFAFGGSGGIVAPTLFTGAAAGSLFGDLIGLDRSAFAAIGMVAMLAGAINTPVSASILAIELFGAALAPYATVACVVSFLMTGHRSLFPTQVLGIRKSSSMDVEIGQEIREVHATPHVREHSVLGAGQAVDRLGKRLWHWIHKK